MVKKKNKIAVIGKNHAFCTIFLFNFLPIERYARAIKSDFKT